MSPARTSRPATSAADLAPGAEAPSLPRRANVSGAAEAVVLGGSAGALEVLSALLPGLGPSFTAPLIVVLHQAPDRPSLLAQVLRTRCARPVREVEDKDPVTPGTVHLAPPGYHLLIERDRHFALSVDDPVHYSRPAIDVLFESAADVYGPGLVALLLTGANEDGARGLARVQQRGGLTAVQSPDEAQVRTMPEAALRLIRPDRVLRSEEMASFLNQLGASAGASEEKS